jgi:hypothetical protein
MLTLAFGRGCREDAGTARRAASPPPAAEPPQPKRSTGFVIPKKAPLVPVELPPPLLHVDADAPRALKFTFPPGCALPSTTLICSKLGGFGVDAANVWADHTAYPPAVVVPFHTAADAAAALASVSGREDAVLETRAAGTTSALFRPATGSVAPQAFTRAPAAPTMTQPPVLSTAWYTPAPVAQATHPAAGAGYDLHAPYVPSLGMATAGLPAAPPPPPLPPPPVALRSGAFDPRRVRVPSWWQATGVLQSRHTAHSPSHTPANSRRLPPLRTRARRPPPLRPRCRRRKRHRRCTRHSLCWAAQRRVRTQSLCRRSRSPLVECRSLPQRRTRRWTWST